MAIETKSFQSILESARKGELQLPEFQRDYVWRRSQVIELFDSLRQRFPIGALLFMERNPEIAIEPRPFEGTADVIETDMPDAFVLDGQQRITSGLALYYGLGASQYYLNLDELWKLSQAQQLNLADPSAVEAFLAELEPDDSYCVGRIRRADPIVLLSQHLLYTGVLHDAAKFRTVLKQYTTANPDREAFVDSVIRDHFKLGTDVHVPVTKVEKNRPVEAVSRIFATLNTTGQPLNAFELVVALLYPSGIRLRTDISDNRELAPHYANMDRTGEIFLQTIALLSNQSPKKSQLPKTIKPEYYRLYRNEAVDLLENLGTFLTEQLGVGLDQTSGLIPYDSIFAPMALALRHLRNKRLAGAELASAERRLKKWFVVAALANRYQEGVHNKQQRDLSDVLMWLDEGDRREPAWIRDFIVAEPIRDSPDGAVGKLLRCLINARAPKDPVTQRDVGERPTSVASAKHHIFPTRWVDKYLQGWDRKRDQVDLALNVTIVSAETNLRWLNSDPANQLAEMRNASASTASLLNLLSSHFISQDIVEILERPNKTKEDYEEFLNAREALFLRVLEDEYSVVVAKRALSTGEVGGAV